MYELYLFAYSTDLLYDMIRNEKREGTDVSFVYASKSIQEINGQLRQQVNVFSETMIKPKDANSFYWGERTLQLVQKYGLVKSMILTPKCCFCFAGNDIHYANIFLEKLYSKRECSDDELITLAASVHKEAGSDNIEFIFCLADEEDHITITCIKEGTVFPDCTVAWLGMKEAHDELQRLRIDDGMGLNISTFRQAIEHCQMLPDKDDGRFSVGGFIVEVMYDFNFHQFIYPERLESVVERSQTVLLGETIQFVDSAENGGYTAHYLQSTKDFVIELLQPGITIGYSDKYRVEEANSINSSTNHLMLPILVETATNHCLL